MISELVTITKKQSIRILEIHFQVKVCYKNYHKKTNNGRRVMNLIIRDIDDSTISKLLKNIFLLFLSLKVKNLAFLHFTFFLYYSLIPFIPDIRYL